MVLMKLFAGKELRQIKRTLVDTVGGGEGGTIDRVALTYIHYHV